LIKFINFSSPNLGEATYFTSYIEIKDIR
jgi:hypothetical protein